MLDSWGALTIAVKLILYVCFIGATGLTIIQATFATLLAPEGARMRARVTFLSSLALIAAMVHFMLGGAALVGGADGMVDHEMLSLLWHTASGDVLVYRLVGATLIIVGMQIPRIGQWIALAGGVLGLWSFAQIGHVSQLEKVGVQLLLLFHLLGIAFWFGVLFPLRDLSRQTSHLSRAATLGHQFGQIALIIVPALILAGVLIAWMLLGDLRALIATDYGRTLLIKLALVGTVLTLAAINKTRLIPAMMAEDSQAARHLKRSIDCEIVVILLVFGATATLTSALTLPN